MASWSETKEKLQTLTYSVSRKSCLFLGQTPVPEGFALCCVKSLSAAFFPHRVFAVLLFKLINEYTSRISNWVDHEKGAEMSYFMRQTKGNTNAEWLHTASTAQSHVGCGRPEEPGDHSGKKSQ